MEIIQNGVRVLFLPEIALVIRRMMKGITQGDGTPGRERPGFFFCGGTWLQFLTDYVKIIIVSAAGIPCFACGVCRSFRGSPVRKEFRRADKGSIRTIGKEPGERRVR